MRRRHRKVVKWIHVLGLLLFWPALCLVIWGQLKPNPTSFEQHYWDKGLHFIAYFGLAGLATWALEDRKRAWWAVLGLIALGGLMEILQGMFGRDMSFYDEVANSLGALCGYAAGLLALALAKRLSR